MLGMTVLALTGVGLLVTAGAQIRPVPRLRFLLDTLAIVPEWRFFAQASTMAAADLACDTHLVVRDRDAAGRVGGWRAALWYGERRLHHALWNPQRRVTIVILTLGETLAEAWSRAPDREVQQSIRYLVLLRRALEVPRDRGDAVDRQFAIVRTIGRAEREIAIDFVSAWHRW